RWRRGPKGFPKSMDGWLRFNCPVVDGCVLGTGEGKKSGCRMEGKEGGGGRGRGKGEGERGREDWEGEGEGGRVGVGGGGTEWVGGSEGVGGQEWVGQEARTVGMIQGVALGWALSVLERRTGWVRTGGWGSAEWVGGREGMEGSEGVGGQEWVGQEARTVGMIQGVALGWALSVLVYFVGMPVFFPECLSCCFTCWLAFPFNSPYPTHTLPSPSSSRPPPLLSPAPGPLPRHLFNPSTSFVSSPFGWRWGSFHEGVDLAAEFGAPVLASDKGVVWQADDNCTCQWLHSTLPPSPPLPSPPLSSPPPCHLTRYGKLVTIAHDNGFTTRYGHCCIINARVGQRVARGQQVACVGATGRATGPHLHFEGNLIIGLF
ncbi:unnamed protein product, partial [Closterium sp. NIES-54]